MPVHGRAALSLPKILLAFDAVFEQTRIVLIIRLTLIRLRCESFCQGIWQRNFVLHLICKGVECIMSLLRGFLVSALSALACLSWPSPSVSGEIAHLTLQSQPGSFIGGGQNWDITYTPQNSQSFFAEINQTLPNGQPDYISFIMGTVTGGSDNTYATLDFSTVQLGTPLQPGTYDNAQRAAFAEPGHPGLDVTFQNSGSNVLTGSFTINELSFYKDQNNNLEIGSFSVSFAKALTTTRPTSQEPSPSKPSQNPRAS